MSNFCRRLVLTIAVSTLLAACGTGPHKVKGEPPIFAIDNLLRKDSVVVVDLGVRNINDRSLEVTSIDLELRLDEKPLASGERTSNVTISARSREVVRLEARGQPAGLALLDELADGRHSGLRWQMDLTLTDERGREETTESNGWLHAVPGQPDRFR